MPGGKKVYVLKQTCSFQLQVCLSMYDLTLPPGIKGLFRIYVCCFIKEGNCFENLPYCFTETNHEFHYITSERTLCSFNSAIHPLLQSSYHYQLVCRNKFTLNRLNCFKNFDKNSRKRYTVKLFKQSYTLFFMNKMVIGTLKKEHQKVCIFNITNLNVLSTLPSLIVGGRVVWELNCMVRRKFIQKN